MTTPPIRRYGLTNHSIGFDEIETESPNGLAPCPSCDGKGWIGTALSGVAYRITLSPEGRPMLEPAAPLLWPLNEATMREEQRRRIIITASEDAESDPLFDGDDDE